MKKGLIAATSIILGACASTPPPELNDARKAYENTSQSEAAQIVPADVHAAQEALATAEQSFVDHGDSDETRDLAYAAQRKALTADVRARAAVDAQQKAAADTDAQALRDQKAKAASAQLEATQQQLAIAQQARADAEQRARMASADLARIASVKQEDRGMVITLSGGVLFASAKSDLLPQAQAKLSEVANVLTKQDKTSTILVQGYTDSQGSQSNNQALSQRRAEAVRTYLVAHGIAADRVTAQGMGPSNPVADNTTAEGRADNRRVEIVVQNQGSGPSTTGSDER
jgi:outer membrane protein OmpA-like peptidoglycan-associated protein